jgi:hypothetical protein
MGGVAMKPRDEMSMATGRVRAQVPVHGENKTGGKNAKHY